MTSARRCRRHPKVPAGWNCDTCKSDLCPDCVGHKLIGGRASKLVSCVTCGRPVNPITIHRSVATPLAKRLLTAPTFPFSGMGILSLGFVGFFQALTSYAGAGAGGGAALLLRYGLFWAFIFFIIRSTADGANRMGVFGFRSIHDDLVTPALKGIVSTYLLWIPAAIYIYLAADDGIWGIISYPAAGDPVVWILGLFGVVYAPMALLGGATDLSLGVLLNPVFMIHTMVRMGRDYLLTVVAIGVAYLAGILLQALAMVVAQPLPVPFFPRWLVATVGLYAPFVAARMLGLLLYVRGQALDWGKDEDYFQPVLPDAVPQGGFASMTVENRAAEVPAESQPIRKKPAHATPAPIELPEFMSPPLEARAFVAGSTPAPLIIPLGDELADLPPPPPGPTSLGKPVFGKATRVGYSPASAPADPSATQVGHAPSVGPDESGSKGPNQ